MYGPVALLLLLAAGYALYWRSSADALAERLDNLNGHEVMPGITFAFAQKDVGGFPFRLDVVLSGVTFAEKTAGGETAWRAENIALHMLSYGPNHFLFEAAGLQTIDWPGGDGRQHVWYVQPGTARASAMLRDGKLAQFDLDLVATEFEDANPKAPTDSKITADRIQFHLRTDGTSALDVALNIEGARIGMGFLPYLGPELPLVSAEGKLSQAQAFANLLAGTGTLASALESWRKANGTFDISDLTLNWGDVQARGNTQLSLDEAHRPKGKVIGFVSGGKIFGEGEAIRILAGTTPDADGRIPLTLTVQDGLLKLHNTLLAKLDPAY